MSVEKWKEFAMPHIPICLYRAGRVGTLAQRLGLRSNLSLLVLLRIGRYVLLFLASVKNICQFLQRRTRGFNKEKVDKNKDKRHPNAVINVKFPTNVL
jgi:hypothetical protein